MTSRGSAVERFTLVGSKVPVLKSVEDMIMMFVGKLGCDLKSVNLEGVGEVEGGGRRVGSKKRRITVGLGD